MPSFKCKIDQVSIHAPEGAANYTTRAVFRVLEVEEIIEETAVVGAFTLGGTFNTGGIYRTIDGGLNWNIKASFSNTTDLISPVVICNNDDIVMAMPIDDGTSFYRSDDGGETWSLVGTLAANDVVYSMIVLENGDIIAGTYTAGGNSGFFRSTDNGSTWLLQQRIPNAITALIVANNDDIIAGVSTFPTEFWRSQDNGATWASVDSAPGEINIKDFVLLINNDLLACTRLNEEIWRSQDNGATWAQISSVAGANFPSTMTLAPDNSVLLANLFGAYGIYRSADNGINWTGVLSDTESVHNIIQMGDSNTLLAFGEAGNIYRSTDGAGVSWSLHGQIDSQDVRQASYVS